MRGEQAGSGRLVVRRGLIDLARRRARPGAGSSPALLASRTALMRWPDLSEVLRGIPWAVVGAVATRKYMAERQTSDLDVAVGRADGRAVRARLGAAGYEYLGDLRKELDGPIWRAPGGEEVDVLEMDEPWWPEAVEEAQRNRDLAGLPILPLPYLVLTKLEASRAVDVADLSRMLGQADPAALDRVRAVVRRYRPQDSEGLEHLIHLGKLELGEGGV